MSCTVAGSFRTACLRGALALILAGGACSRGAAPAPGSEGRTRVVVSVVEVGRGVDVEKRIDRPADSFFPEDPIYVSVSTRGKGRASLTARFVLEDGRVVHDDTQNIVPDGPAVSEFHVMNPAGWPAGTHRVEILVDGRLQDTRTFTVRPRASAGLALSWLKQKA
jgi:hypothetical protein